MSDKEAYKFQIEPLNMFRFFSGQKEVLRLDDKGFHYKGQTIDDAGEAYGLFINWMKEANAYSDQQEEVDRLREKKKQIYDDLKDAVDREWVGLTDEEIEDISNRIKVDELSVKTSTWHIRFARAVERKLKEKNT